MISRSLPRPLLRVLPHPVLSVLLLLVWLLLVDSFAIGHWLLGAFLGVCIPLLTNRPTACWSGAARSGIRCCC